MNGFLDKEQRNMQEFIENISVSDIYMIYMNTYILYL